MEFDSYLNSECECSKEKICYSKTNITDVIFYKREQKYYLKPTFYKIKKEEENIEIKIKSFRIFEKYGYVEITKEDNTKFKFFKKININDDILDKIESYLDTIQSPIVEAQCIIKDLKKYFYIAKKNNLTFEEKFHVLIKKKFTSFKDINDFLKKNKFSNIKFLDAELTFTLTENEKSFLLKYNDMIIMIYPEQTFSLIGLKYFLKKQNPCSCCQWITYKKEIDQMIENDDRYKMLIRKISQQDYFINYLKHKIEKLEQIIYKNYSTEIDKID